MNNIKFLKKLCLQGLEKRQKYFVADKKDYIRRMQEEYNLIVRLGYVDYFLIIWDIVTWAKDNGIEVGCARGSVAGSLLAFLIEITDVDPIKFDLMFERFLNEVRSLTDPPDIDLDFQASRREEVKNYIYDRYGNENVCAIGAHSRAYASGAIKDVAKVMGLNFQELNKAVAHQMYDIENLVVAYEKVESFKKWVDKDKEHQKAFEIAKQLEGLVRYRSVHPAGLVITKGKLSEYLPVYKIKDTVCSQWKDEYVMKRGILKIDILGLKTLDILQSTQQSLKERVDLLSIPLDDKGTLDLFSKGETSSVFQFDAYHLREITKKLHADIFDDLVVATTIARPGSSDIGITDSVIDRKHGREKITYPHQLVEELLKKTYGYPIYQELVMKMAHIVGKIPLTETEIMRDAIKHFRSEVMARYENDFLRGAKENNATEEQAKSMWEMVQSASSYTYNRSHAVSYSLISYWCGYFKKHYPLEYMTACLKHEGDSDKVSVLITECRRMGLPIMPAHINISKEYFHNVGGKIYAGLTAIKHVGEKAAKEIVSKQPFKTREEFLEKIDKRKCNKRVVESLQKVGAFGIPGSVSDVLRLYGVWLGDLPKVDLDTDLPQCINCSLYEERYKVVVGTGNPVADVMFVGEAPGFAEDKRGIPFVGKAGRLLRSGWIPKLGLRPADVWITNVVKCLPKSGAKLGKPDDEQIAVCSLWLEKEIEEVKPKMVVALGGFALRILSTERSVMSKHGEEFILKMPCTSRPVDAIGFSLFHPAYILRQRGFNIEPALKELKKIILEVRGQ